MTRIWWVIGALDVLLIGKIVSAALIVRPYHVCTVAQIATKACHYTHVQVKRPVTVYQAYEDDGDQHGRMRDPADTVSSHYFVAECIPELPCKKFVVGQVLDSIGGILRWDPEHGWPELHPIEWRSP